MNVLISVTFHASFEGYVGFTFPRGEDNSIIKHYRHYKEIFFCKRLLVKLEMAFLFKIELLRRKKTELKTRVSFSIYKQLIIIYSILKKSKH